MIFLAVTWELPQHLGMRINQTDIVSSDAPGLKVTEYVIPVRSSNASTTRYDFSKDNAAAIISRRGVSKGRHPNPNRIPGDPKYVQDQLRNEVLQLRDLLRLIGEGAAHHATGLAAALRRLIGEAGRYPLLQLVAADFNAPLIVYTSANPRARIFEPPAPTPDFALLYEIELTPTFAINNPIDLDVWLELDGAFCRGRYYSNKQTIKAVGNTVGAHIDPDIHPLVAMLRASQSDFGNRRISTQLLIYVRKLAIVSLGLSQQLLSHS